MQILPTDKPEIMQLDYYVRYRVTQLSQTILPSHSVLLSLKYLDAKCKRLRGKIEALRDAERYGEALETAKIEAYTNELKQYVQVSDFLHWVLMSMSEVPNNEPTQCGSIEYLSR
jgi:hypothetical protein